MWGIGEKSLPKFHRANIRTIGDLAACPIPRLKTIVGEAHAEHLHALAQGMDERPVEASDGMKSVSHEHTFLQDSADREVLEKTLLRLSEKLSRRAFRYETAGRTVHLTLRFEDFSTKVRSVTLKDGVHLTEDIFREVKTLFEKTWKAGRKVRLLGVGLSHLDERDSGPQKLFKDEEADRRKKLRATVIGIAEALGETAITRARLLDKPEKK